MGVLQRFERRLEGMVEGTFARVFKSELQPVEVASAVQHEMDERAAIVAQALEAGLLLNSPQPDALRFMPALNVTRGEIAEMIDGQYMGPAASAYRSRAADIMEQAQSLLSAVDDLDTAARIETRRLQLDESFVDAVALLCRLHDAYERVAQQRLAFRVVREGFPRLFAGRAQGATTIAT